MRSRQKRSPEEYQTPPEELVASALHVVSGIPGSKRPQAVRRMAQNFRDLYDELKMPQPDWVHMLSEVADRGDDA